MNVCLTITIFVRAVSIWLNPDRWWLGEWTRFVVLSVQGSKILYFLRKFCFWSQSKSGIAVSWWVFQTRLKDILSVVSIGTSRTISSHNAALLFILSTGATKNTRRQKTCDLYPGQPFNFQQLHFEQSSNPKFQIRCQSVTGKNANCIQKLSSTLGL